MKKIYTRTGDGGTTRIHGGERVPKDDIRIEANGSLDELNALLGVVRSLLPDDHDWHAPLASLQRTLMEVMSHVATPAALRPRNPNPMPVGAAAFCEAWMDELTAGLTDNAFFLLPGGTPVAAHLQLARTVARRAERRLWTLNRQDEVPADILRFVNRLSDLLFVLARCELQRQQWPEERWQAFAYKRKNSSPKTES